MSINILGMALDFKEKCMFSLGNEISRNVVIFGVDIRSSPHIDNKKNIFSLLVKVLHRD